MKAEATIFLVTVAILINVTVSSDNNENLKSLLSDTGEAVTPLSKLTTNQNHDLIHPEGKEDSEKKPPSISVVGIDDDGKRTDAVLKTPGNSSNVESLEKESSTGYCSILTGLIKWIYILILSCIKLTNYFGDYKFNWLPFINKGFY